MAPLFEFEVFFKDEYEPMVRALTLALGNRGTAEDAAQEAFSRALDRWSRVGMMERPAAWVYVVALRHERRQVRRLRHPMDSAGSEQVDEAAALVDRLDLTDMLDRLTARQRRAVVLRYHADLSLSEVAAALGCRVGTVKATLHQALGILRISSTEEDRQ